METKDINITLPIKLIEELDARRIEVDKSRSEYIKELIRADLRQTILL